MSRFSAALALALAAAVALVGCGGVKPHQHPEHDPAPLFAKQAAALKAAVTELKSLRAEVGALRGQVASLEQRLYPVEQRTGLSAFAPAQLDHLKDPNFNIILILLFMVYL